jgi:hypothetical protein
MARPLQLSLILALFITVSCAGPTPLAVPVAAVPAPSPELVDQVDGTLIGWIRPAEDTESVTPADPEMSGKLKALAEEFAEASEVELIAFYPNLGAFTVRGDLGKVRELARNDPWEKLLMVGSDFIVSIYDGAGCLAPTDPPRPPIVPTGVERVGGPFYSGFEGKRAWIIDTGIDLETANGQINIDRAMAANCMQRPSNPDDPKCSSGPTVDVADSVGHGTMVAGIIAAMPRDGSGLYGVAPGATIVPVKAIGADGYADFAEGPMRAIDYVTANAAPGDVINISWGGDWSRDLETFLTTYSRVNAALRRLAESGVRIAIAAGNDTNWVQFVSPAGAGGYRAANGGVVMTASAVDSSRNTWFSWKDKFWPASNYGVGTPDFAEPGVNVMSLWPGNKVRMCSGTSFAAPHLAGILLRGLPREDGYAEGDLDNQGTNGTDDPVGRCCVP